ncbi:adapter molecule Crk isoform X5 [Drosophila busckii]|uniref:adapter molecule Crk isoform X5 n=1 Tax=Drosophila busckii TaxID=30019 RepID=UPI00083EF7B7|nr:adapter molecule Crk isoform X5 [Drosophila busckii]XP_017853530.1 adapter molecule Crk isoform X5 [Drosophila busckii]
MDTFDVSDRSSWYFGSMSRQDATEVLMNERERGVFLVRDSNSIEGDYVLCVRIKTIYRFKEERFLQLFVRTKTNGGRHAMPQG